jgi:hypothetical protein
MRAECTILEFSTCWRIKKVIKMAAVMVKMVANFQYEVSSTDNTG